ncbi:uncharacterized protein LOC114734235 [Neltuma alba]|uniref:uncharacterized protein LOC114734235 n=1 Tax=Neltuma alba TaxID=207710 RepID=UPI0010A2F1E9|nr:uncharacterized protein LOC114734235 [Prosopis alba]
MHTKSDSEVTSVDQSWPARSPRRPLYYVQSPSNHDVEKMSYGSSPLGSPHHYYHSSPIHHSRESSTSRFSVSLKNPRNLSSWKKLHQSQHHDDDDHDDDVGDADQGSGHNIRLYLCFILLFVLLFTVFSLILWGASKSYGPKVLVKNIVFENLNIQAGNDDTGVPTDMLSLNSTVRIVYRNPATFFGVHVTSTPLELHYYQLSLASGQMKKFYVKRKKEKKMVVVVSGHQVPLYGGVSALGNARQQKQNVALPLNLTFVVRSRAHILGSLVRSKFYRRIRCSVTLHGSKLGKPANLTHSCLYN